MANSKDHSHLWEEIAALPLDRLEEEQIPDYRFEMRLRDKLGWPDATVERVIAEYRRFLYLAALGAASPSEKIDEVWHMHLTYSRPYRIALCERVLGRPLDHMPSGNREQGDFHARLYRETLSRYRETFGTEPPADIWPAKDRAYLPRHLRGFATGWFVWACIWLIVVASAARVSQALGLFACIACVAGTFMLALNDTQASVRRKKSDGSGGCGGSADGGDGDGGGCGGGCGG